MAEERTGRFIAGMGAGAVLAYFLDPDRGRSRRANLGLGARRFARAGQAYFRSSTLDLAYRGKGALARARRILERGPIDDDVLVARVRSKLGRFVSHPHSVQARAQDGRILLEGVILAQEAEELLAALRQVHGVKEIEDRLDRHSNDDFVPGLQGGLPRQVSSRSSSSFSSLMIGGACGGIALMGFGRKSPIAWAFAAVGAASILRSLRRLESRRQAVTINKTLNISAPIEKVFDLWSHFENFPEFLTDVKEIRVSDDGWRSRWYVEGPAGIPISWEAQTLELIPDERISWASVPGAVIKNSGLIQFLASDAETTRVDLHFSYHPPGGLLAHLAARIFGADPKSRLDRGLAQLKTLLERGPSPRQDHGLH